MKLLPDYIKTDEWKEKILQHLQEPKKMKIAVTLGIGFLGIGVIGIPMRAKMRTLEAELLKESQRQEFISTIQQMKTKDRVYQKYLNKQGSLNWWIEYILNGSRMYGLKVLEFKPYEPKGRDARPGTYQGMILQFKLSGSFENLIKFTRWMEDNKWSMRITRLTMQKEKKTDILNANLTVAILVSRSVKDDSKEKKLTGKEKQHKEEKKHNVSGT